jgi:hypothetical protein
MLASLSHGSAAPDLPRIATAGGPVDDDDMRESPPAVIAAVAAGVAPTPFLTVYAVLFLAHGFLHPVQPPDITTTQAGEAAAGVITSVLLVAMIMTLFWFIDGRRRWPFILGQLATLVTAIRFLIDSTTGAPAVSAVLAVTSAIALLLALLPASGAYVRTRLWLPAGMLARRSRPETEAPAPADGAAHPSEANA